MTGSGHLEIVLRNLPADRKRLVGELTGFAASRHVPDRAIHAVDLALEEHLTNVFHHAYAGSIEGVVRVRLACTGSFLEIEIEDEGPPFDPTGSGEVDVSVPLEQRAMGGLGIHLMRQFMDVLEYRREKGRNILRMTKRFESPPENSQ